MKKGAAAILLLATASMLLAGDRFALIYDFEESVEGWKTDWGLKEEPTHAKRYTAHGKGSLMLQHHFKKDQEAIAVRAQFDYPEDFAADPNFKGFSAWVYFPSGSFWEAQMYANTGGEWEISWGKIHQRLNAGWHRVFISKEELGKPDIIQAIGVQVKNFDLNSKTAVYIDYVQAVYAE